MEFKKPQSLKRSIDSTEFSSPCNRKKTKSLSTTIATPEAVNNPRKKADMFEDDQFSQFFRSQFIRQIAEDEAKAQISKSSEYNFTQIDGLSQWFSDSDFENSIVSGQKFVDNPETNDEDANLFPGEDADKDAAGQDNLEFTLMNPDEIQFEDDRPTEQGDVNEPDDLAIQSSQVFLKELTTLQLNISSIVDETIKANKFSTQDFIDPGQKKFEVFKSNVTHSQYLHMKRPNEPSSQQTAVKEVLLKRPDRLSVDLNTESFEDQLLAEMVMTTQTLAKTTELLEDQWLACYDENENVNSSEQLNECIDPDSSALAELFADEEKENDQNIDNDIAKRHEEEPPRNNGNLQFIKELKKPETTHSPVTAAKFFSIGPFFGLPLKVKKLIQRFKNIDDLYGMHIGLGACFKSNSHQFPY